MTMSDVIKNLSLLILLFVYPTTSFSDDAEFKIQIDKAAKKVGCTKPLADSATRGRLSMQKSDTVLFYCNEFSPKRVGYEYGALVIYGADNHCPLLIQSGSIVSFKIVPAEEGFGSPTKYGDLKIWKGNGMETTKYVGKNRNEVVLGNVIETCLTKRCSLTYTYVCGDSEWLFLGRD